MNIRKIIDLDKFPELSRLIKETSIYGFGYVITNLSAFFLLPLYLKWLSPAEYGLFSLAKAVPNLIITFLTLGLNSAIIRFYYEWKEKKCEQESVFTVLLFVFFWVFIATFVLLFWGKAVFGLLLKSVPFDPYLKIAIWTQAAGITLLMLNHLLRVKGQFGLYSVLNNVSFLLTVGLSIFYVAYQKRGVEGALLGGLVSNLVMLVPALIIIVKNVKFKVSIPALKESLSFCLPQLPGSFMNYFLAIADRFFLDKFVPVAQIGVYSLAKTVASIVAMITGVFQFCLIPFYMRIAAERMDHRPIIGKISRYFIYLTILLSLAITVFAPEVIFLLGKVQYMGAASFVGPLVLVSLIESLALFPNVQILLSKVTKYTSILAFVNLIIFLAIGYPLISRYAVIGVIISYICTDIIIVSTTFLIGHRLYAIPINAKKVGLALLSGFVLALIVNYNSSVSWLGVKMCVMLVFFTTLARIEFGREMLTLIKRNIHATGPSAS